MTDGARPARRSPDVGAARPARDHDATRWRAADHAAEPRAAAADLERISGRDRA